MLRPNIEERRYAFEVAGDLVRYVTVLLDCGNLTVTSRFATEVVERAEARHFANVMDFNCREEATGLVLTWRSPLFNRRGWPLVRHGRRF